MFYGNEGRLEYDFVVAPGADPSQIRIRLDGAEQLRIDKAGDLSITLDGTELTQLRPTIYQEANGERQVIDGSYVMGTDGLVRFEIGDYDRALPLVIDPILVFSTYLGGNAADIGRAIAVDSEQNVYVTGQTISPNFPLVNPIQSNLGGGSADVFVTKINAAGNAIVYSTYIGGSGGEIGWGRLFGSARSPLRSTPIAFFPRAERADSRALTSRTGTPAPRLAWIRLGHSSVSISTPTRGR